MADTMRERIARALCLLDDMNPDGPNGEGRWWELYLPQTDAVLNAMLPPTVAMVEAGWRYAPAGSTEDSFSAVCIYEAMLTAALAPGKQT